MSCCLAQTRISGNIEGNKAFLYTLYFRKFPRHSLCSLLIKSEGRPTGGLKRPNDFMSGSKGSAAQVNYAPSSDTHLIHFTMTSQTSKKVTPSFGKTSITEPSQPFEGRRCDTRGKSDYNTPTGYTPTLQRRSRRRAEKNSRK